MYTMYAIPQIIPLLTLTLVRTCYKESTPKALNHIPLKYMFPRKKSSQNKRCLPYIWQCL